MYSFKNEEVHLEIRQSGAGLAGYWIVQKAPKIEPSQEVGFVMSWFPTAESAAEDIGFGHVSRAWDGASLKSLGVPTDLESWERYENSVGVFDR